MRAAVGGRPVGLCCRAAAPRHTHTHSDGQAQTPQLPRSPERGAPRWPWVAEAEAGTLALPSVPTGQSARARGAGGRHTKRRVVDQQQLQPSVRRAANQLDEPVVPQVGHRHAVHRDDAVAVGNASRLVPTAPRGQHTAPHAPTSRVEQARRRTGPWPPRGRGGAGASAKNPAHPTAHAGTLSPSRRCAGASHPPRTLLLFRAPGLTLAAPVTLRK